MQNGHGGKRGGSRPGLLPFAGRIDDMDYQSGEQAPHMSVNQTNGNMESPKPFPFNFQPPGRRLMGVRAPVLRRRTR